MAQSDESDHHASPRLLWFVTGLTLGYAGVEAAVGWWAGSLALVADAGHMVNDAGALALAAAAVWFAQRPASRLHSYGFGRAEFLAALVNSLGLLVLVAWLAVSAVQRLQTPQPVAGAAVSVTATLGLLLNILVAWLLSRGERTLNIRAAARCGRLVGVGGGDPRWRGDRLHRLDPPSTRYSPWSPAC